MPGDSERGIDYAKGMGRWREALPFSEEDLVILRVKMDDFRYGNENESARLLATIDTLRRDLSEARGALLEIANCEDTDPLSREVAREALGREVAP